MTPPGRQPPPVVPTLTEVVAGPTVGAGAAAPVPQVSGTVSPPAGDDLVDTVTDRVLARLLPELEWRIADALQAWLQVQVNAGAAAIADALREEIANRVREGLGDVLGSTRN